MANNEEFERLKNDLKNKEVEKKLKEACDRIFKEGKAASENEAYVAAAKELGYEISLDDLKDSLKLDQDSLDEIGGGIRHRHNPVYD